MQERGNWAIEKYRKLIKYKERQMNKDGSEKKKIQE